MKYKAICPHCKASNPDILAIATCEVGASATTESDDSGNLVNNDEYELDDLSIDFYSFEYYECRGCGRNFYQPLKIPVDDDAKKAEEMKRLEAEGQQNLLTVIKAKI